MDFAKIDELVWQAVFGHNTEKNEAYQSLWQLGQEQGVRLASINDLYMARGKGEVPLNFTVPAMNLRGMAYDMARALFQVAVAKNVGALILEIARSEIGYCALPPMEYVSVMIGAALREGFQGPLFIQGDHYQVKESGQPGVPKEGELDKLKKLIKDSIEAGFFNIDLDMSTMVDYSKSEIKDQQQRNYELSVELTKFVRAIEPSGITVSLGGEIGHIGGKNSTEEELRAYMDGYNDLLPEGMTGLSKISIQTGTHHGGVPLPDGTLAQVDVDFKTLKDLAVVARTYHMGGTVQHGASTLPEKYFSQFPQCEAVEVHLATEFQNIMMDHPSFPSALRQKMYSWIDDNCGSERTDKMTDEQFHYKLRKKAWGQFKRECWELPQDVRAAIKTDLGKKFGFMFGELKVENTKDLVSKYIQPPVMNRLETVVTHTETVQETQGLAD